MILPEAFMIETEHDRINGFLVSNHHFDTILKWMKEIPTIIGQISRQEMLTFQKSFFTSIGMDERNS